MVRADTNHSYSLPWFVSARTSREPIQIRTLNLNLVLVLSYTSMIKASYADKSLVVDLLSQAFDTNLSVNYIIPQDQNRKERIRRLIEYSFDVCYQAGEVYFSDDRQACALIRMHDQKHPLWNVIRGDIDFSIRCITIFNVFKAMKREKKIRQLHSPMPFFHLWFVGFYPESQNKGISTKLLREVIHRASELNRPVYLETSTLENLTLYEKLGFNIFAKLQFTYTLFLLRLETISLAKSKTPEN